MTRRRNIIFLAAIGGLTSTIALSTGLPAANADELADLRATQANLRATQANLHDNQELLQRRIDQLAQTAPRLMRPGEPGPVGVSMTGGSFPRSFLIPGTDTSIRVGGFTDMTIDYWLSGGPANGNITTTVGASGQLSVIPLDIHGQTVPGFPAMANLLPVNTAHSRGHVYSESSRESRLNVETRTPTAWGESRTFFEFDFAGAGNFNTGTGQGATGNTTLATSDNLTPLLRYAYGTWGGFLAGQANSNFADPDANGETLDFSGPIGQA